MASIYKPTGRAQWHTSFFVPVGAKKSKKVTRSTGETDKKKAQKAANDLQEAAMDEVAANSPKSRAIMEIISQAKRDALKGTLNDVAGREYIREMVKISTGCDMPQYTIAEWVAEWMKRKAGRSEASLRAYKTYTEQFLSWLGDRGENALESLTVADMREYRQWLLDGAGSGKKNSTTTVLQKMKTVSSLFCKAIDEGVTNHNPTKALEPLPEGERAERKPFTQEEISKLVDAADTEEWKGFIIMGAFTGLRLLDCANIEWREIDMAGKEIVTIPRKTKRKKITVRIPIHPSLYEYLKSLPTPIDRSAKVFPELSDISGAGRNGLSKKFARIMEKANVSRGKCIITGSKKNYERGFHSLRHTLVSFLANANVPEEVRMQITGHQSKSVHATYSHHELERMRAAMANVPKLKSEGA